MLDLRTPPATPPDLPSGPWPAAPAPGESKSPAGRLILLLVVLVVAVVVVGLRFLAPSGEEESGAAPGAPGGGTEPAAKPRSILDRLLGRKKEIVITPEEAMRQKAMGTASLTEYNDPAGYFTARFPKGYAVIDQSGDKGTRVQLDYGRGVSMTIMANELEGEWNAEAEMSQKVARVTAGSAGLPTGLQLASCSIVEFGGLRGFETSLAGVVNDENVKMQSYTLAGNGVTLQLAVTCRNPLNMQKFEQVKASIPDTLKAGSAAAASGGVGPRGQAVPAFTEADWDLARKSLRVEGIVKKGNAYVALVGGRLVKEGDVISVYSKGEKFWFVVTSIQPKEVAFEPTTEAQ